MEHNFKEKAKSAHLAGENKWNNDYRMIQNSYKEEDLNKNAEHIKNLFPMFYEDNIHRIEKGLIVFLYEPWAGEFGFLLDLETKEHYSVDTRA